MKHDKKWIKDKTEFLLTMDDLKRQEIIDRMMAACDREEERFVIAMHYIFGLRPGELITMETDNFLVVGNLLNVKIKTLKGGVQREIRLDINTTPFLKNVILPFIQKKQGRLFDWNHTTNINAVFKKVKKKLGENYEFNPNVFRHFRLSWLGYKGANIMQLKAWKGARSYESIEPYLDYKPITEFERSIR
ncbi:MAG: site-specific integrase [Thermoplasmata archaeon]